MTSLRCCFVFLLRLVMNAGRIQQEHDFSSSVIFHVAPKRLWIMPRAPTVFGRRDHVYILISPPAGTHRANTCTQSRPIVCGICEQRFPHCSSTGIIRSRLPKTHGRHFAELIQGQQVQTLPTLHNWWQSHTTHAQQENHTGT